MPWDWLHTANWVGSLNLMLVIGSTFLFLLERRMPLSKGIAPPSKSELENPVDNYSFLEKIVYELRRRDRVYTVAVIVYSKCTEIPRADPWVTPLDIEGRAWLDRAIETWFEKGWLRERKGTFKVDSIHHNQYSGDAEITRWFGLGEHHIVFVKITEGTLRREIQYSDTSVFPTLTFLSPVRAPSPHYALQDQ